MIKLLSLFSGIGAFECALRRGGHEFQTINYCEIDKYASAAYSMIHNVDESLNLHDVRKVSTLLFPDVDLVTYGFPCQDISCAGRQRGRIYDPDGLAPTLNTVSGGGLEPKIFETKPYVRIRKLTPRECFRLMGFADDDFDKIKGISNSQLYKMAGNSIVVNVLTEIFKELFKMYK